MTLAAPVLAAALAISPQGEAAVRGGPATAWARAFDRGDYERATALARDRLRAVPRDVRARLVMARAEAALGRLDSAYQEFRRVLAIQPRNTDALYYLAILGGVLAASEYDRLFGMAPDSARAHQLRGDLHAAQDRPADAEVEYKAGLAAAPASAELLIALGDLTRHQSRFEEALAYYERAAVSAPRNYDVLYGLGVCRSHGEEYAQAIEAFRGAVGLDPSSAPARLALGHALLRAGQPAAAVPELQKAAILEPRMVQAQYLLGRAYTTLRRSPEAAAAFERVKALVQEQGANEQEALETGDPLGREQRPRPSPSPRGP